VWRLNSRACPHVLMENRHALVADTRLALATGTAEREAALDMAARLGKPPDLAGGRKRL